MGFIFDIALDFIFEASNNKKISKPIRCLLITILVLFFASIAGVIIYVGIDSLKDDKVGGIITIALGVLFLIASIIEFIRSYKKKK